MDWTFKSWIARFAGVDLPIGDLVADIDCDRSFPGVDDYDQLLDHITLVSHNAPDVIETFKQAWSYYLASAK